MEQYVYHRRCSFPRRYVGPGAVTRIGSRGSLREECTFFPESMLRFSKLGRAHLNICLVALRHENPRPSGIARPRLRHGENNLGKRHTHEAKCGVV
jgi:hypothetical protein